ncbi:MAG: hypothetical protein RR265_01930 [Cetobacterium sp.]|uniref:hypothetical protein n=1 Tax=Cetobacterium sp. TaxID=2071632 RepID=UPI002FC7F3D3
MLIPNWKKFELNTLDNLKKFETSSLKFRSEGGSNSTEPDIKVYKNNIFLESLECKLSPAQGGQFVVLWNGSEFQYSSSNVNPESFETIEIIKLMNKNKLYYSKIFNPSESSSIDLDIDDTIVAQHLINIYKAKKSNFIVSSTNLNNDIKIIPIEKIKDNFNIIGKYRIKRSGSINLPLKDYSIAEEKFTEKYGIEIFDINTISFDTTLEKKERYFGDNSEYFLGIQTDGTYKVKKLSNTFNANVIFTLSLKSFTPDSISFQNLIDILKNK